MKIKKETFFSLKISLGVFKSSSWFLFPSGFHSADHRANWADFHPVTRKWTIWVFMKDAVILKPGGRDTFFESSVYYMAFFCPSKP